MTLDDIITLRVRFEERIAKAISDFEAETACTVDGIDLHRVSAQTVNADRPSSYIGAVHATVRLP